MKEKTQIKKFVNMKKIILFLLICSSLTGIFFSCKKEEPIKEPVETDNNTSQQVSIYVYPNPTSGLINVYSLNKNVKILSCEVFNIFGTPLITVEVGCKKG